MFMRVAIKKINVQEIYKCNLISSYYRYRNYLTILLEIHLYLFLMPKNLQSPKQWLGCEDAEASTFHTVQHYLLVLHVPSSAAFMHCTGFKTETAFLMGLV